jgi:hypothetical protein
MSRDAEAAKNDRLFDKRTVERSIKKGLITRKDYEKHLKSLEDVGPKGVFGGPQDDVDDDDDMDDVADDADDTSEGGGTSE